MNQLNRIFLLLSLALISNLSGFAQTTGTIAGTFTSPCNNNGVISVTVTGLTPPLDYYYSGGAGYVAHLGVNSTTDIATGLGAKLNGSSWIVVVTDGKNYASQSFPLVSPFTGSVTVTKGNCPNPNTLQVTQLTGGTSPFTFLWTNILTAQTHTGNPAVVGNGNYSVVVTDAAGCSASVIDSLSAFAFSPVNVSVTTTAANCTNGSAWATVSGGISPYTYLWHNSATSASITGLSQGPVLVTATDAQGCQAQSWDYVQQGVTLNLNSTITNATCVQNNGAITTFITGGTAPYTYMWSSGATTPNLTGVVAGSYQLNVLDANNCSGQSWMYVSASTPISVTFSSTASSCTASTGGATITPTGGQSPYTITWNTFPATTGTSISGKPPGTYSFKVVDANGCVQTGAVVISPVSTINAYVMASSVLCPATTGNVITSVSGSNPPFTYNWNNAASTSSLSNMPLGVYTCTITDNVGCKVVKSDWLNQISPVNVGVVSTPVNCLYATNGSAAAVATGGVGPYTYAWTNGQTTASITGLAMGDYWVTATDANGCKDTQKAYVGNTASVNSCYCTITGTVYADANSDCAKGTGENGIQNIQVYCSNIGYAYTNSNGVYSFQVPTGSYTITESVQMIYPLASCQTNNQVVSVVAATNCSTTVNFANNVVPLSDLHIITSNMNLPVPGNTYTQQVIVQNEGTLTESTIKLGYAHDGQLGFSSCAPWSLSQQNSSAYPNWYSVAAGFPTLAPTGVSSSVIKYNVPTNIPISTQLNFNDTVAKNSPIPTSWLTDNTPWNNVNHLITNVVSSYDPNFKEVSPAGFGSLGEITRTDSVLTYIVHFQNEGTWYAQNVVVVDTLDANLQVSTLRPGYSDHKYVATIDKNNVLRFTFTNINLPYKSSFGDLLSSGMFVYTIKVKPKLPVGTQIRNSAAIYFDYNEPVITNKTLNTITEPVGISESSGARKKGHNLSIYPNPARSEFFVRFQHAGNPKATISVTDISGRLIYSENVQLKDGNNTLLINNPSLQNGIYFVQLKREDSVDVEKIVISK